MHGSDVKLAADLRRMLLRFPELVDGLQGKDPRLPDLLREWLEEGERILQASGVPECARLAAFRSSLLVPIHERTGERVSVRKRRYSIAARMLFEVQAALSAVYSPIEARLEDCRNVLRHLLAVVQQSGLATYEAQAGFQAFVDNLWTLLSSHEQLKPGMVKVRSLVSRLDARLLLAEAIDLAAWSRRSDSLVASTERSSG